MKKFFVKFKCNGKNPCIAFRTVEAKNAAEAITIVNNYFNEIGKRETRQIIAVYEQIWNIDPNQM
ncbi:MAG: hypothetical protein J6R40_00170 [Clostridia bacterium]|nr:hypothetical protein [Clostridia bacterium]